MSIMSQQNPSRLVVVFATALICLVAARYVPAQDQAASPRQPKGIEDFSLTERSGQTITKGDLLGRPWVAGFVFTRCAGPCPRVTGQMKLLQEQLKATDVQLVTFTVDPKHDTVEVLRDYAGQWGANTERWWFLTGDQGDIYHLIHHSFEMPVVENVGEDYKPGFEIIHSVNLMHVDAQGRVVGKYDARDDVAMVKLRRRLRGETVPEETGVAKPQANGEGDLARPVPEWVGRLPAVNASLNGMATLLLLAGFALIRAGKVQAHKTAMLTAFATSIVFLGCYLVYHATLKQYTGTGSRTFPGVGPVRTVYYGILISHVILAAVVPVIASMTIYRGLTAQWERHKRIARVTFPIWLYVSVTGVIIYAMLYHWPVNGIAN